MSVKWISYIWDKTDYREGSALVALALADFANDEGHCYPKMGTLAKKARLSVRQVQRIIRLFESDGFLQVVRNYGRGKEPVFQLKKVTSVTPFKDRKKVTSTSPISEIKGDICDIKKVTSVTPPPTPPYKDEPSLEPSEEEAKPRRRKMSTDEAADYFETVNFPEPEQTETEKIYREFYPDVFLSPYQLDLINEITLLPDIFRSTLRYWKGKNNSATNIDGLTDRYGKEVEKQKKPFTGFIQTGEPRRGLLSDAIKR